MPPHQFDLRNFAEESPRHSQICCFGGLHILGKHRKEKYERLVAAGTVDMITGNGVKMIRLSASAGSKLGRCGGSSRRERSTLMVVKMRKAYMQGLAMVRQSGPHLAELFRGNSLMLLSPMAATPLAASKRRSCSHRYQHQHWHPHSHHHTH